jgi:hypothetical protein
MHSAVLAQERGVVPARAPPASLCGGELAELKGEQVLPERSATGLQLMWATPVYTVNLLDEGEVDAAFNKRLAAVAVQVRTAPSTRHAMAVPL